MRRSICYIEPNFARAGSVGLWKFIYTTSQDLPKGTTIKFDLLSEGRSFDWQIPSPNQKDKSNIIWGELPNGKTCDAHLLDKKEPSIFEFTLPSVIKTGENFVIWIGTKAKTIDKNGNRAQTFAQRRRAFNLAVDPKGKSSYKEIEPFYLDVRGSDLSNLRIIAPSFVSKNKRFDVIVRFEDEFGNLTHKAPEGTLITLTYENLRENLNWQLFVPETGFIALPNLYFNEEGVYRIKLINQKTKKEFISSPIKCFGDSEEHLFWGMFHGETERIDSSENIEGCLRFFRDEVALQFVATSPFEMEEETIKNWKNLSQHVSEFNEEERFIVYLGFQWVGNPKEEGLRQILFLKDQKQLFRKKDLKYNALKKIYKTYTPKDFISIPSFTMGDQTCFDFKDYNPDFERVVEIYNAWGSSECSQKEGNMKPITGKGKKAIHEAKEGSIQLALKNNCRFGFIAGGLDDRGIYSPLFDQHQVQYTPGMTAIISKTQTRESFFEALYKRSCYATTGAKILLGFQVASSPMGSELNSQTKPGLLYNRYISGYVIGTNKIKLVEIIRNGKVVHTFNPNKNEFNYEWDDLEPLSKAVFPADKDKPPFVYYYLRVTQDDGHMAWSSPIWIDYQENSKKKKI
jgi:hypothetical protein